MVVTKAPLPAGPAVTVVHDGWTVQSASKGATAAKLTAQLGAPEGRPEEQIPEPLSPEQIAAAIEGDKAKGEKKPAVVEAAAEPVVEAEVVAEAKPVVEDDEPPVRESARARKPQAQIDKWRRNAGERERERDAAKAEADRLRAENEALRRAPVAAAPVVVAPTVADQPVRPKWSGEGGYEAQGKTYEDFEVDRDNWLIDQGRREAVKAAQATAEQTWTERQKRDADTTRTQQRTDALQAAKDAHVKRMTAARAKYDDFDDAVDAIAEMHVPAVEYIAFNHDAGGDILYYFGQHPEQLETLGTLFTNPKEDAPIAEAIRDSAVPLKLLAHYASKPAEFSRLLTLRTTQAVMEIGALASKLDVAPAVSTPARRITSAAPPLRTVDRGARVASDDRAPTSRDIEFGPAYIARANKEEREAARRRGY